VRLLLEDSEEEDMVRLSIIAIPTPNPVPETIAA
jgi:hypothetical protein